MGNYKKIKLKPKMESGGDMENPYLAAQTNYKNSNKEANAISAAVNVIPVAGQFIAAGMAAGNAIGKKTVDQYGIYKNKAAGFVDQTFNPATHIQNFKDIGKKFNAKSATNMLSGGLFGKSATQQIRQKNIDDAKVKWERDQKAMANNLDYIQNPTDYTKPLLKNGGHGVNERVVSGGRMKRISTKAVQVKGHNPSKTDGVETENAFLDHNEVVDSKKRVFSNTIKLSSGATMAQRAKAIEESRESNPEKADRDLDDLFNIQESNKKPMNTFKPKMEGGGNIPPRKILLTRRAKDKAGLEAIQGGGSYTIKSRNKVANPNNPNDNLSRGSRVTVKNITESSKGTDTVTPGGTETRMVKSEKEIFTPGDRQEKVYKRNTTEPLGKSLKENTSKTAHRINFQEKMKTGATPESAGGKRIGDVAAYNYKGKVEHGGQYSRITEEKPVTTKLPPKITIGKTNTITKKQIDVAPPKDYGKSGGGLGLRVRRVSGINNKGQGQNYKRLDLVAGKKTLPIIKVKTGTRRTK